MSLYIKRNNHNLIYDGKQLFAFGCNDHGQLGLGDFKDRNEPILLIKDREIQQIVYGLNHTFILKNNGELFGFGSNYFGQLGLNIHHDINRSILL